MNQKKNAKNNYKLHKQTFRIRLSKKDLDVLLKVLFYEISYTKKHGTHRSIRLHWKRYEKISLSLLNLYSQPMNKERKMFPHTLESLDVILSMLEIHLYRKLKDDFSINLYERLSQIYKKRQKEFSSVDIKEAKQ